MADCKALFVLDRTVLLITAVLILLLLLILKLRHDRIAGAQGILWGACFALLAVTVLAVWAVADFDGLFVLFHHLSFSNDLWLLNPATDMLIRLMPQDFFVHYVTLIVVTWLLFLALLIVGSALCAGKPKGRAHA